MRLLAKVFILIHISRLFQSAARGYIETSCALALCIYVRVTILFITLAIPMGTVPLNDNSYKAVLNLKNLNYLIS
jgi:hypothetical protein